MKAKDVVSVKNKGGMTATLYIVWTKASSGNERVGSDEWSLDETPHQHKDRVAAIPLSTKPLRRTQVVP